MKFELNYDDKKVTLELGCGHTWSYLMEEFVYFLRGCGYYVPDGEWVETDVPATAVALDDDDDN